MNLENLTHADFPFNHWVFSNCLEEGALDEISFSNIPSGERKYDPPVIASLITGAVIRAPSKTMANLEPTFSDVILANRSEPSLLKEKATTGSF